MRKALTIVAIAWVGSWTVLGARALDGGTMPASDKAYATSTCRQPNMNDLLAAYARDDAVENYFPAAESSGPLLAQSDVGAVQWYGIRWDAPSDGLLYVLRCDGKVLLRTRFGAIFDIESGPHLPEVGDTVVVSYIAGSGTGEVDKDVSVLSFLDSHLNKLWTHDLNSYQFADPTGAHWKTNYQLRFSQNGYKVEAIGTKEIYHPDTDPNAKPDEVQQISDAACWNTRRLKYIDCNLHP